MEDRTRAARAAAARRGELGLTQKKLASIAGVDVKTIGDLERFKRWPTAASRARIEAGLQWPVGRLAEIASEEPEQPHPPRAPADDDEDLVAQLRELVARERERKRSQGSGGAEAGGMIRWMTPSAAT